MTRMNESDPALGKSASGAWAASDENQYRVVSAELEALALKDEVDGLRKALDSHAVIDIARGIIMAAASCTPDQAWQVLVEVSQHTNTKLREIAQSIVDSIEGPPLTEPVRTAMASALSGLDDRKQ